MGLDVRHDASLAHSLTHSYWNLIDVTLADEDINSIQTVDANPR